jgi:two-component system, sensor histidine kinase
MPDAGSLILCVDDDPAARYALTRTLQRAGFRTLEAGTGTEALQKMAERPDLVVLDVRLPDIDGFAVCQRIKSDPRTASTPVLQISAAFVEVEDRTRGLELGADAYLTQPLAPPELIATIRALLRARRAEERARGIVRELESTGKVELRRQPTLLQEAVENAISTSQPLIDERGHRLVRELEATPLCVLADPTRLEQVISNLINNAAKYTEPGGHIQITLRHEGEQAVVTVRDTGIGIEPEMLDNIFELFAQLDHSAARPSSGLGVGLTLVKRLAEMHGGTVQARSEGLSRGSEFEVRLPLLEEKARAVDPRHAAPPPGRKRLLLVEDNPDIGETLRDLLQLLGHRVELAADGLRGVQLALATRPDVALVDIGLPGIDGYEVARRLRATDAGRQILLVALTGYGRPEDRERSLEAGFDAHLVKPVDPDDLNALLAALAGSRKAAGQA